MKGQYTVTLSFSSDMDDKQKDAIVQNILDSLVHTVDTAGLVPDDAEGHTTKITVKREATGCTAEKVF